MKLLLKFLIVIAITIACVVFAMHNEALVELSFVKITATLPLYVLLYAAVFIGLLIGSILLIIQRVRHGAQVRKYKKRIDAMQTELSALKVEQEVLPPSTS